MPTPSRPVAAQFTLTLTDAVTVEIGHAPHAFATQDDAAAARDALTAWSANERLIVVEHLLLRPKFIGDALYPGVLRRGCATCGGRGPLFVPADLRDAGLDRAVYRRSRPAPLCRTHDPAGDAVASPRQDLLGRQ